jgi:hypothetical protein
MTATITRALMSPETAIERLEALRALHQPFGIYTECGHDHVEEDFEAGRCIEVDLVGLTCEEGLMYRICKHCCTDDAHFEQYQTEHCATAHDHGAGVPICQTMAVLDGTA